MCHHLHVFTRVFPHLSGMEIHTCQVGSTQLSLVVSSATSCACCPVCHHWSWRIHSHFLRTFTDLPSAGYGVVLRFCGRRFFCGNRSCSRRTFREQAPQIAPAHQRHTTALHRALERLGYALGGRPAERLAHAQGFARHGLSRMSFLRAVRAAIVPTAPAPCQIGVDDWAWSKGKTYGTLIVDLQRHRPVDLLADRTADTFATWLKDHPGIELISRDRSGAYAEGAQLGAPQALQVADRFHLVKNLVDALEEFLLRKALARAHAAQALATQHAPVPDAETLASSAEAGYRGRRRGERLWAVRHEAASAARHARRVTLHQDIHRLRTLGLEQHEIGRRLGVSRKTVIRYLQQEEPPHRRSWRWRSGRVLDAYEPYLLQRWAEGCHSGRRLWHEIQAQGYAYSFTSVSRFVARLRREGPPPLLIRPLRGVRRQLAAALISPHGPSARQVAFLLLRAEQDQQPEEAMYLELLAQRDHGIALASTLSTTFLAMVHERCGEHLHDWITDAQTSGIGPLRRFAQGLLTDYAAVLAGLTLPINNGQLEGQINRLKMIKRQMFGRANFDLLKQRVLYTAE